MTKAFSIRCSEEEYQELVVLAQLLKKDVSKVIRESLPYLRQKYPTEYAIVDDIIDRSKIVDVDVSGCYKLNVA